MPTVFINSWDLGRARAELQKPDASGNVDSGNKSVRWGFADPADSARSPRWQARHMFAQPTGETRALF